MRFKIKEILVVLCLVVFIVFLNMRTSYAEVSVETIMESILEVTELGDMEEYSPIEIKEKFGINVNEHRGVAYFGYTSVMDCDTLLVVCLQDEAQGKAIVDTITEQRDELMKLFQSYAPEQYELLRTSVLIQEDRYLLYVVSPDAKAIEASFVDCITE